MILSVMAISTPASIVPVRAERALIRALQNCAEAEFMAKIAVKIIMNLFIFCCFKLMGLPCAGGSGVLPAELICLAVLDLKLRFKILEINNLAQINLAKLLTSKIYQMLKHLNPSRVTASLLT